MKPKSIYKDSRKIQASGHFSIHYHQEVMQYGPGTSQPRNGQWLGPVDLGLVRTTSGVFNPVKMNKTLKSNDKSQAYWGTSV